MKDKKNIIIILLLIVSLSLGGYLIYDKAFQKKCDYNVVEENTNKEEKNTNSKEEDKTSEKDSASQNDVTSPRKDYEYVGLAFNGYKAYSWQTSVLGKTDTDPDETINNISIPKILIDTTTTKEINQEIYDKYKDFIEVITTNNSEDKMTSTNVSYRYAIYKDILFILVQKNVLNHRGSGFVIYEGYYYDIKNDKELTSNEVINRLNINTKEALDKANQTNEELSGNDKAKYICNVIPNESNTAIQAYYTAGNSCSENTLLDSYVSLSID